MGATVSRPTLKRVFADSKELGSGVDRQPLIVFGRALSNGVKILLQKDKESSVSGASDDPRCLHASTGLPSAEQRTPLLKPMFQRAAGEAVLLRGDVDG
jgi:hypothetical protein